MNIKKKKWIRNIFRAVLIILIFLNLKMIFGFSAESGEESAETSTKVATKIAEVTVKDFEIKPIPEKIEIVQKINRPVRKAAHMTEFGSLGALIFLFLLTFKGKRLPKYMISVCLSFVFACIDEWSQKFSDSRGPQFTDVLIDTSGAILACAVIVLILLLLDWIKKQQKLTVTNYEINADGRLPAKIAVISDLHNCDATELLKKTKEQSPDLILIVGDLTDDKTLLQPEGHAYTVLRNFAAIAPTVYSIGNHEIGCYHKGNPWKYPAPIALSDSVKKRIRETGVLFLDNEMTEWNGVWICGLTSGINRKISRPDLDLIQKFANTSGYHVLLCHHPEYYVPFIKQTGIELTLCGHAHGGQWRFFGHGIYSPGQGIFPKYTSGILDDGKWIISRGVGTHTWIPRLWNSPELIILHSK